MISCVDLNPYMGEKNVLVGKDFGEEVRLKSNLDFKFKNSDLVVLVIPHKTMAVNPSFLKQLFSNIVKDIGVDSFISKLDILHYGKCKYESDLAESISRIKREIEYEK